MPSRYNFASLQLLRCILLAEVGPDLIGTIQLAATTAGKTKIFLPLASPTLSSPTTTQNTLTMPPTPCFNCKEARAVIIRPKNRHKLCRECFIEIFETEVHETVTSANLFFPGERIAIGASGGTGQVFGFVPFSFMVKMIKGGDYFISKAAATVDGTA